MSSQTESFEKSNVENGTEHAAEKPTMPPEEGLKGWLCIVGATMSIFSTFGFLNAAGVFQTYYETNILSQYSPSTISWIFALQLCLMWAPGPLFGRLLAAFGATAIMIPCSVLCVFALCMTSLCKEYYQIILAQGLCFGFGAGGVFTTAVVCAGQWFERRRGLAMGITISGASIGGVIFPFFVNRVMDDIGFAGALRYTALLIGILQVIACALVTCRVPRKGWDGRTAWVNFRLFTDRGFSLYTAGAFLLMLGLWGPFDFLSSMAKSTADFSDSLALYLIALINAGSFFGRIIPAHIADTFGYFNMMTIVSFAASITIICLWIPFDYHPSHAGLMVFSVVYGFVSGGYISLLMPCAFRSGSLESLGQRFGMFQAVMAVSCLIGLPIQGAILNAEQGKYLGLQLFCGISMFVGAALVMAARIAHVGFVLNKGD
ncbi:MAG: hypothetical protein M1818_003061 [Claussenomyces sp. TS43310]|nr:MAG: hypothetical protein M1818_003061 [Claussenomyces sp. TS43310]